MATVKQSCHACGATIDAGVGQYIGVRGLVFWVATRCPHCGAMTEADGGAEAPEEVRRAIIAEGGLWALHVDLGEGPKDRLNAATALRAELGLSVVETADLKARLPCEVARGTQTEMDYLRMCLATRTVTSRLVLIEPGTGAAREPVETPLCQGCKRSPESTTCTRCGERICLSCRGPTHCPRCSFDMVRDVLAGARGPVGIGEAKVVRALLGSSDSDVRIDALGIERRWAGQYNVAHFDAYFAPFAVGHLLDRAGVARLEGPTVAAMRVAPVPCLGSFADSVDFCAWFIPEPNALRILLRARSELPPTPQPIPPDGPFAIPPAFPRHTPPSPKYREEPSPRACPHCGHTATRFRDLGNALVCPSCARSFAP